MISSATRRHVLLLSAVLASSGCRQKEELYCSATQPCIAGHPVCDIEGICPMSGGIANTCIPEACWDAATPPGSPDAAPADAPMFDAASNDAGAPDANTTCQDDQACASGICDTTSSACIDAGDIIYVFDDRRRRPRLRKLGDAVFDH